MLILNIDTATEHASVCLSENDVILGLSESTEQKNHAAFVQPAIEEMMSESGYSLSDLSAVAVTIGPGSYTGLRVGLASAKGICFALDKPLLTINTLQVMAWAAIKDHTTQTPLPDPATLFCPLIDARRMEVFTGLYTLEGRELTPPHALIIDKDSFQSYYHQAPVVFSGSGHNKLKEILTGHNIRYSDIQHNASHLAHLGANAYQAGIFADLAYSAPLYVKEFFDTSRRNS